MRHAKTPRQCLAHLHSLNRDNPPLSTPAAEAQDITTPLRHQQRVHHNPCSLAPARAAARREFTFARLTGGGVASSPAEAPCSPSAPAAASERARFRAVGVERSSETTLRDSAAPLSMWEVSFFLRFSER
uniref:Uncharacterized protein n=1 Tax=Spumella elongata TaxID=89044 RepID=A0A7S3HS55_9STRA